MWTSLMDKSPTRPQGLPEGPAACDLPTAIAHKKVQSGKSQSKTTRIFRKIYSKLVSVKWGPLQICQRSGGKRKIL